jgi:hypothetical protein
MADVCSRCGSPVATGGCINSLCPAKHWNATYPVTVGVPVITYPPSCKECVDLVDLLVKVKKYLDNTYVESRELYEEIEVALARHYR